MLVDKLSCACSLALGACLLDLAKRGQMFVKMVAASNVLLHLDFLKALVTLTLSI